MDQRFFSARFPRTSAYNPEWIVAGLSGGANPLWLAEWLCEALDLKPGMRVLDLGCGDGRLITLVLDARPAVEEIVGVDNSPPMLERARERFGSNARVALRTGDLAEPLAVNGPFDVVTSGFAIHHVADARKRALFAEVRGLLAPGGTFANLEVVASPIGSASKEFRAVANAVGNTSTLDAFLGEMKKRYPDKDVSGLPGASPPETKPAKDTQAENAPAKADEKKTKAAENAKPGQKPDPSPTGSILPPPKKRAKR